MSLGPWGADIAVSAPSDPAPCGRATESTVHIVPTGLTAFEAVMTVVHPEPQRPGHLRHRSATDARWHHSSPCRHRAFSFRPRSTVGAGSSRTPGISRSVRQISSHAEATGAAGSMPSSTGNEDSEPVVGAQDRRPHVDLFNHALMGPRASLVPDQKRPPPQQQHPSREILEQLPQSEADRHRDDRRGHLRQRRIVPLQRPPDQPGAPATNEIEDGEDDDGGLHP